MAGAACKRSADNRDDRAEARLGEISDSLAAGRIDWAMAEASKDRAKALAEGDSMLAMRFFKMGIAAEFYAGNYPAIPAPADTLLAFGLNHSKEPEAAELVRGAAMLKGAYYQTFELNGDSCIHYQRLALRHSDRANPSDYIVPLANLGDAYKRVSRFAEATDTYYQGVLFADSIGMPEEKKEPLVSGLAATYTAMGDFEEAEKWWARSERMLPQLDGWARFLILNNIGNHQYLKGDYPASLETFNRLEVSLDTTGGTDWERNFVAVNKADVLLRLNRNDSAKLLLDRAETFFETEMPGSDVRPQLHNLRMRYYAQRGNYARVEELVEAHPVADSLPNDIKVNRLKVLEDYYTATHQWREAYGVSKRLSALEDSLFSQKVRQSMAARKMAYERDTRMLELQTSNSLQQARIFRLLMILGFSILVVVALVAITAWYRRRVGKREERMYRKIIDLRMESARNRITPHFIYNALSQELVARKRGEQGSLEALVGLLRRQQVFASEMMVPLHEEVAFLRDYVSVQSARSSEPFEFIFKDSTDAEFRGEPVPSMSLQILAENAFKHGFPSLPPGTTRRLFLSISKEGEWLVLEMENNCSHEGSQSESLRAGTGLRIITETLAYLEATARKRIRFSTSQASGSWKATLRIHLP